MLYGRGAIYRIRLNFLSGFSFSIQTLCVARQIDE